MWAALGPEWQAAFDEAWASWSSGCFGIGAVAVRDGAVVARGRNRILETKAEPGVLADTMLAHAEMNVLAALSWGQTDVTLLTTLEPCLMCASTILQAGVREVHFAGPDPMFGGVPEALAALPYAARREPVVRNGPMEGPLAAFGALLPLTFVAFWSFTDVLEVNAAALPAVVELARDVAASGRLTQVVDGTGTTLDALRAVWDDLPA